MLRAVYQEIIMELKATIRYSFGFVSDIAIYGALLVAFMVSDTGQSLGEKYGYADYKVLFLIGYLAWLYAVTAVSALSQLVTAEMKQGTFYRLCNAKYPLPILLGGKMIAQFVVQSGIILVLLVAVMRKVIAGQSYGGELVFLVFLSFICLMIGICVLHFFYNKARRKGNLLFY